MKPREGDKSYAWMRDWIAMSNDSLSAWWRRYEGPAIVVCLITAIFMAGASWLKLESVAARADIVDHTVSINGNRITTLEANTAAIRDSLADIKDALRDINNDLKTRR